MRLPAPARPSAAVPVVLTALVLAGCAGAPSYEGAEPAEFAEVSCTTYLDVVELQDEKGGVRWDEELDGLPAEEQKSTAIAEAEDFVAAIADARAAVEEVQPAVEDGEAIIGLYSTFYEAWEQNVTELTDGFRDFPAELGPNGHDTTIEINALFSDLEMSEPGDFPFTEVEDQDILAAFDEAEVCSNVVNIIG